MSGSPAGVDDDAATLPDTDDDASFPPPTTTAAAAAAAASPPVADADGIIRVRLPPLAREAPSSNLWSLEEDAELRASMRRLGPPPFSGDPFPRHRAFPYWSSIAADLPNRSARACFSRYSKFPTPPKSLVICLWSEAEVAALHRAVAHHAAALERASTCNDTWALIGAELAEQGFPARGAKAAYAKWHSP